MLIVYGKKAFLISVKNINICWLFNIACLPLACWALSQPSVINGNVTIKLSGSRSNPSNYYSGFKFTVLAFFSHWYKFSASVAKFLVIVCIAYLYVNFCKLTRVMTVIYIGKAF